MPGEEVYDAVFVYYFCVFAVVDVFVHLFYFAVTGTHACDKEVGGAGNRRGDACAKGFEQVAKFVAVGPSVERSGDDNAHSFEWVVFCIEA